VIRIKLNGETQQFGEKQTLAELLGRLSLSTPHFAVAVNRSVVPRSEHENLILQDGDEVEVVHPMGGG
jgi:sulfur carrier protein